MDSHLTLDSVSVIKLAINNEDFTSLPKWKFHW